MAHFCEQCGTRLSDGAQFCPECGARIAQPQPQQQAYQQQPYPYQAYQQPSAPAPAEQKHQSGPKRSKGFMIAVIALAVVMAIEGVIAGVWYPGFFNPQKSGSGSSDDNGDNTVVSGDEEYWSPPGAADVIFDFSEAEIADAPSVEMNVTADTPSASAGGFSVDFGEHNYLEDDTFIARTLPERTNENAGYIMETYDFSLASGRSEFVDDVAITIPRNEDDGDGIIFVTQDPDTGENVEQYYEISEDGKSYILYTDHFSLDSKVKQCNFNPKEFADDVKTGNVSKDSTRKALSSFFLTSYYNQNKVMTAPVAYSHYDLWSKITDSFTGYLPSSYSLMAAIDQKAKETPKGELPKGYSLGGIMFKDQKDLEENISSAAGFKGAVDDAKTVLEEGNTAFDKLCGINETVEEAQKAKGVTVSGSISIITTAVSFELTNRKAIRELEAGKYADVNDALWGNWEGYAGTMLTMLGMAGAAAKGAAVAGSAVATGGAVLAIAAAAGGLALFFYSKSQGKLPYDDLVGAERNYREYYVNGGNPRRFYYDSPEMAGATYGEGATGNIKKIETLSGEQNEKLKQFINQDIKSFNGIGGIAAEDTRDKVNGRARYQTDWLTVVEFISSLLEESKEPEKLPEAVKQFYHNYAAACWELSESDFISFSKEAMKVRGETGSPRLPDYDPQKNGETPSEGMYTAILEKELFVDHQQLFYTLARKKERDSLTETDQMIKQDLLPLLNTQMEFTVEDGSLRNPKDFTKSIYNAAPVLTDITEPYIDPDGNEQSNNYKYWYDYPMTFRIKNADGEYERLGPPVFLPGWDYSKSERTQGLNMVRASYTEYYPNYDNFIPLLRDKSGNAVFRCTYYNYLLMGAPRAIAFKDVSKKNSQPEIVDFEIPQADDDGVIRVKVEIEGESTADESVKLRLREDETFGYSRETYYDGCLPYNVSMEISDDDTVVFDLPSAEYEHTLGGYTLTTMTRGALKLHGVIDDVWDSGSSNEYTKYGHLTSVPQITGTSYSVYDSEYNDEEDYTVKTVNTLNKPDIGDSFTHNDSAFDSVCHFEIKYKDGKVYSAAIIIAGDWKRETVDSRVSSRDALQSNTRKILLVPEGR